MMTRALPFALVLLSASLGNSAAAQEPPKQAPASPVSIESRTALRCAAAFAIVADRQARGDAQALAYPPLARRGQEFFVRSSAQVMDASGLDRTAVAAQLRAEAARLVDTQGKGGTDTLDRVMPPCLLLLEASGL